MNSGGTINFPTLTRHSISITNSVIAAKNSRNNIIPINNDDNNNDNDNSKEKTNEKPKEEDTAQPQYKEQIIKFIQLLKKEGNAKYAVIIIRSLVF